MLVLVNDMIVELESPEAHANLYWNRVFETDPKLMPTSSVLEWIRHKLPDNWPRGNNALVDIDFVRDIAAIIVTYTGANVALFPADSVDGSTRITCVSESVLRSLQAQCARGRPMNVEKFWRKAA